MGAYVDLTGRVFGKLVVVRQDPIRRNLRVCWECRCECGATKSIVGSSLTNGLSLSCGCNRSLSNVRRFTRHGMTQSQEHKAWRQAITRCTNPNTPNFADYGGRGIKMHPAWLASFETFYESLGPKPTPKHSLDRIDANGDYAPGNCRWATRSEQNRNTRSARRWFINGKEYRSCNDAAAAAGVSVPTILKWCRGYRRGDVFVPPKQGFSSTFVYEVEK